MRQKLLRIVACKLTILFILISRSKEEPEVRKVTKPVGTGANLTFTVDNYSIVISGSVGGYNSSDVPEEYGFVFSSKSIPSIVGNKILVTDLIENDKLFTREANDLINEEKFFRGKIIQITGRNAPVILNFI